MELLRFLLKKFFLSVGEETNKNMEPGEEASHDSWMMKTHKVMKKANNSLIGYMSHKPHWPIPPVISVEKILKPQHKNVEKIINKGFDLFKHKKTSTPEQVHQLRLLENHLIQWRFVNDRAHAANHRMSHMAQLNIQLASISQRRASDLTESMKSVLSTFSPLADKTAELLSELAEVVVQERFLLEEFSDIFQTMRVLELQESSLMCNLIQLKRTPKKISGAIKKDSDQARSSIQVQGE
ncbi:hypothetical protein Fmac_021695 [Flemingia macrophylla]|uniref:Uncharacterized protein n=1 Tax=Flemingia macrophylla TaxID=520843 RepID=A0ABD1LXP2_9FABA